MESVKQSLIDECLRQSDSCKYTSTTFYIWLRAIRAYKTWLVLLPIVFGGFATWSIFVDSDKAEFKLLAAVFALLASIIPAIYEALKLDVDISQVAKSASVFKRLQDRFRVAALVTSLKDLDQFEEEVRKLLDALDAARAESLTPPERFFKKAQEKIHSGDYDFDVDNKYGSQKKQSV